MRLSEHTTLGVGGDAPRWIEARSEEELLSALCGHDGPVLLLGGGSNLVVADAGPRCPVIAIRTRGLRFGSDGMAMVAAGEPWDEVVAASVEAGLSGIECLSGIPGLAGATPIQNVGAYGQEVGDTLAWVRAWDLEEGREVVLQSADLDLAYRHSALKGQWRGRFCVLEVALRLRPGPPAPPRYGQLSRAMQGKALTLAALRQEVLTLRRSKSMVYEAADPFSRSAGSFFTNPVVSAAQAEQVRQRAALSEGQSMPAWEVEGGRVKLAAAWLIEQAGFPRGTTRGSAGLSPHHALALYNRGGATAADVIALAREVRDGVEARFGVRLRPEPVFVGFEGDPLG